MPNSITALGLRQCKYFDRPGQVEVIQLRFKRIGDIKYLHDKSTNFDLKIRRDQIVGVGVDLKIARCAGIDQQAYEKLTIKRKPIRLLPENPNKGKIRHQYGH